jgi:hypothetical protein
MEITNAQAASKLNAILIASLRGAHVDCRVRVVQLTIAQDDRAANFLIAMRMGGDEISSRASLMTFDGEGVERVTFTVK